MNKADLKRLVIRVAEEEGVDPSIMLAIAEKESGFNPNAKNYSSIEKSQGMFQINTDAHPDYKGGFDPEANTRYATRFMKRLLKQTGNVAKAIERYNGSGEKARQYSESVMNNILPKYKGVSQNSQLAAYDYNDNLQGGVQRNIMSQQNPNLRPDSYVQGVNPMLVRRATQSETPFMTMYKLFLNGQIPYEQLASQFPDEVAQVGITPEMQGNALPIGARQAIQQGRVQMTPEQASAIQYNDMIRQAQLQNAYNQQVSGERQALEDAYNQYQQTINNNPNLQNQGFYVDPQKLATAQESDRIIDSFSEAMGLANPDPNKRVNRLIQNEIARVNLQRANAAGIPYDQLIEAQKQQYTDTIKMIQEKAKDVQTMYARGQGTFQQYATALQQLNDYAKAVQAEMDKTAGIYEKVLPEVIKGSYGQVSDITKGGQDITAEGMRQAGNITAQDISQMGQTERQSMGDISDIQKAQIQAAAAQEVADINKAADVYKADKDYQRYQDFVYPTQYINAMGNLVTGAGMAPNVNMIPLAAGLGGITEEQARDIFDPTGKYSTQIRTRNARDARLNNMQTNNQFFNSIQGQ